MAIRQRLQRGPAAPVEEQKPTRLRFTPKNQKPTPKPEPEEDDYDIPEEFKSDAGDVSLKGEENLPDEDVQVKKVVVPPPSKPIMYHKREVKPVEKVEVAEVETKPMDLNIPGPIPPVPDVTPYQAPATVDGATLVALLERVVAVQEDLVKIIKTLAPSVTPVKVDFQYTPPAAVKQPEVAPVTKPVAKPAAPVAEISDDRKTWEKHWKSLSFDEKVAEAKKLGVEWAPHANQARENINLTMAIKRHLGYS